MPRPRGVRGAPIGGRARLGAVSQRDAQQDRAHVAARAVVHEARRGPAMVTSLEMHLQGLGSTQLKIVVAQLFLALAEAHAVQRNPSTES